MKPLTPKQARFVEEYLIDLNARKAAVRAGYSAKTAEWIGPQLLGKSHVAEEISAGMAKRQARTEITQDKVLTEIARIAFGSPRSVMTWGPRGVSLKDSELLSEEEAAIVSEVSETTSATGGTLKLKTHDRVKALELLGRHLGMFNDKLKVEVETELATRLKAARERAKR